MSDNFTFDGKHSLNNMGIHVVSVTRPLFPEPKTIYEEIPGKDGELNFTANNPKNRMCFKPRIIELECHFAGYIDSRESYIRKIGNIARWIATSEDKRLIFDSEPDIYYMAHAANLFNIQDITDYSCTFPIVFKCDPFRYSTEELACWDIGSVRTTIDGYYTPVITRVSGTAPNGIKLTHKQSGKTLHINTPFENNYALIDSEKMTVTMNGISILHKCEGEFYELSPGNNNILVDYGEDGSGDIYISYSERFL